jgi:fused signal recognition particle receptor
VKKKGIAAHLGKLFGSGGVDEEFLEELEEALIEGDIGARSAMEIVEEVEKLSKKEKIKSRDDLLEVIRRLLKKYLRTEELDVDPEKTNVLLILGVNGVGKTTTIAKIGHHFREKQGMESVFAAADTFRAAAIDQLQEHGRRLDFRVISQKPGADPGAVVYDAIESVRSKGEPLVIADTAGRMHTKANLVRELQKIDKIVTSRISDGTYRKLMVIDATTGQNALRQAEMFHEAIGLDGMILAKYDSASKGGIAVSICRNLEIPFMFMGTGEKYGDLEPFDVDRYLDILLGDL